MSSTLKAVVAFDHFGPDARYKPHDVVVRDDILDLDRIRRQIEMELLLSGLSPDVTIDKETKIVTVKFGSGEITSRVRYEVV